ncbi:MAG: hypothetical protein QOI51_2102 [Nocardioidaceae bacterium]|nr:hypothetical protein [Nocardioidaceae bacterium]
MTVGVVKLVVTTGADRAQGWVSRPDSGIQTMIGRVHLRHRLTRNLGVSGSAVWSRFANTMRVQLAVAGPGISGRLHGSWDTRVRNATAVLTGRLAGSSVSFAMRAP